MLVYTNKTKTISLDQLKTQCEMKYRLVFFDTEFLRFILKVSSHLNGTIPNNLLSNLTAQSKKTQDFLRECIQFCQEFGNFLNRFPLQESLYEILKQYDQNLEERLGELYQYRIALWEKLLDILENIKMFLNRTQNGYLSFLKDFIKNLFDIEYQMEDIIKKINLYGDISDKYRIEFTERLERLSKDFTNFNIDHDLYLEIFFGALHHIEAKKQQMRILFLQNWYRYIKQEGKEILKDHPQKGLQFVLKAKHLVYNIKQQYYIFFYQNTDHYLLSKKVCTQNIVATSQKEKINADNVMISLEQQEKELRQKIAKEENKLKNYGWSSAIISSGIRLFTESFYYKWSSLLFDIADENTEARAIHLKLSESYQKFFTTLLASTFIGLDNYFSRWIGMSYIGLNSLTQFILADLDSVIALGKRVGFDEETIVKRGMSKLKWLLGFGLYMSFYSCLFGLNIGIFSFFAMSYLSATSCSKIGGCLMDKIVPSQKSRTYNFFKNLVQQAGYVGGTFAARYSYSYVQTFFAKPPSREEMLEDIELCKQYRKLCKKNALDILGLDEQASLLEVRKQLRRLAKKYHPDKNPEHQDLFISMLKAKQLLEELNLPAERNISMIDQKNDMCQLQLKYLPPS